MFFVVLVVLLVGVAVGTFGLLFWVLRCLVGFGVCWQWFLGACFLVCGFASAVFVDVLCCFAGLCVWCVLQFVVSDVCG